ncbi:MAG: hypothetical protein J4F45_04905 [Pseudomonadales bacterium]|nr:hypothetical protein [Pseudomonadales bacterium]
MLARISRITSPRTTLAVGVLMVIAMLCFGALAESGGLSDATHNHSPAWTAILGLDHIPACNDGQRWGAR